MTSDAPAIIAMVRVRLFLLPCRSPYAPSRAPPIGRITKATANTARVASSAAVSSPAGKNWPAKTEENVP